MSEKYNYSNNIKNDKTISVPCGNCNKEFKKLESECAYQCYKCYKKLSTV